jgi:hypothetical protein
MRPRVRKYTGGYEERKREKCDQIRRIFENFAKNGARAICQLALVRDVPQPRVAQPDCAEVESGPHGISLVSLLASTSTVSLTHLAHASIPHAYLLLVVDFATFGVSIEIALFMHYEQSLSPNLPKQSGGQNPKRLKDFFLFPLRPLPDTRTLT